MEHVDEIINFLVENRLFLHLKIQWSSFYSIITDEFLQEQIDRYTPSKKHRKKCKDDLCYKNVRLEFIDSHGFVTNSKLFEDHITVINFRKKKCTGLFYFLLYLFFFSLSCFIFSITQQI